MHPVYGGPGECRISFNVTFSAIKWLNHDWLVRVSLRKQRLPFRSSEISLSATHGWINLFMPGYWLGSFLVSGIIQHFQLVVLSANQIKLIIPIFENLHIPIICAKFSAVESVEWH